jgi:hypothetical protein
VCFGLVSLMASPSLPEALVVALCQQTLVCRCCAAAELVGFIQLSGGLDAAQPQSPASGPATGPVLLTLPSTASARRMVYAAAALSFSFNLRPAW